MWRVSRSGTKTLHQQVQTTNNNDWKLLSELGNKRSTEFNRKATCDNWSLRGNTGTALLYGFFLRREGCTRFVTITPADTVFLQKLCTKVHPRRHGPVAFAGLPSTFWYQ